MACNNYPRNAGGDIAFGGGAVAAAAGGIEKF